uniref:Uncharacterized protein n=1 Tax=Denticeps clupeoides TaxID=299321 RepID=A0AAY4AX58_9TELE
KPGPPDFTSAPRRAALQGRKQCASASAFITAGRAAVTAQIVLTVTLVASVALLHVSRVKYFYPYC